MESNTEILKCGGFGCKTKAEGYHGFPEDPGLSGGAGCKSRDVGKDKGFNGCYPIYLSGMCLGGHSNGKCGGHSSGVEKGAFGSDKCGGDYCGNC